MHQTTIPLVHRHQIGINLEWSVYQAVFSWSNTAAWWPSHDDRFVELRLSGVADLVFLGQPQTAMRMTWYVIHER